MMFWMLLSGKLAAHSLAPARVSLWPTPDGWRLEQHMPQAALGTLSVSSACTASTPAVRLDGGAAVLEQTLLCEAPLRFLVVSGISESGSPLLIEVNDGDRQGRTLCATDGTVALPQPEGHAAHARRYAWAGVHHVLLGGDHVLVVLGLGMTAAGRVLPLVTGFALGHSLTLVVCALGWLQLPTSVTESLIALTLLGLADQVIRERPHAAWMAVGLGLLHGLGFGSGLAALGLPLGATGTALLSFNLGVELGQLVVVGVAMLLVRWWPSLIGTRGRAVLATALSALGTVLLLSALR